MNTTIVKFLIGGLYLCSQMLHAADCAEVYAGATRNIRTNERESSELSYYFNKFCSKTGEVNSSAINTASEAIIENIPFKFSLGATSSSQKASEFCRVGVTMSSQWEKDSSFSSTVVVDALLGFNECRAIEIRGLLITHQFQAPQSVIISGARKDSITTLTIGSATFNKISCVSSSFSDDGSSQPFDGSKKLAVPQDGFNISCTRVSEDASGKVIYPRASVGLGTSVGNYTVILPDEELYGYDLASENRHKYEALQQLKDQQAIELSASINELKTRLDNITVKPFAFHTADGPIWNNLPFGGDANAPQNYANGVCNATGAITFLQLVSDLPGGGHGMQTWAGACLKK
ncbi:hypothetical protein [Pseudomonas sp. R62]|uniref:hypothetical protein n=1 Tax=Pseudomonas sp. R62 TaxID=1144884 RepID=UPI00031A0643|nr:hypothetical protein [Pseudomonas sp. R62]